jgi:hypothetical protein
MLIRGQAVNDAQDEGREEGKSHGQMSGVPEIQHGLELLAGRAGLLRE